MYSWFEALGLDLDERVRTANFLYEHEALGLLEEFRSRHRTNSVHRGEVLASTTSADFQVIIGYLDWWSGVQLSRRTGEMARHYHLKRDHFLKRMKALRPRGKGGQGRSLSPGLRSRFLEVIRPDSSENPFSHDVRERNYALLLLFFFTGIRRGEALKLRTSDLVLARNNYIQVVRRPDDPEDPRLIEPEVKTNGRLIPLEGFGTAISEDAGLPGVMWRFLKARSASPGAWQSPFLFLSRGGQPMALNSVNALFATLRRAIPEFRESRLTPHTLRHTYTECLMDFFDARGIGDEDAKRYLNYLNGWSKTSDTGNRYADRRIEAMAQSVCREMQKKFLSIVESE
ncbi:tyrosine-type recombinase/integrase [Geothrix limicola]|nr:site-specific integrase [Geothrix limicola]